MARSADRGRLKRGRNTGKFRDIAGSGPTIQTFGITRFAHLQRAIQIYLNIATRLENASDRTTETLHGSDKGSYNGMPGIGQYFSRFTGPADVFGPVQRRKA